MTEIIDFIQIITIILFILGLGGIIIYERSQSNATKKPTS